MGLKEFIVAAGVLCSGGGGGPLAFIAFITFRLVEVQELLTSSTKEIGLRSPLCSAQSPEDSA